MDRKQIEALVRPNIRTLAPYSTARDEFKGSLGVFLDANESPFPSGWNRYPDPRQKVLKERFSQIKGIAPENIFLGNGSDEAIDLVFRVFCIPGKDNVVAIEPSYGMYAVAAATNDIEVNPVRLREDFSLPVEAILDACDVNTKAIFLCSPNNPSGNAFEPEDLLGIVRSFNGMVVVDEAYADFSSKPSLLPMIAQYPNLIILQTCSKARGLAALRLGLAFGDSYVISLFSMVKYPYNINEATQRLALEALKNPVDDQIRIIKEQRAVVAGILASFPFVEKVFPSDANFILVRVDNADSLYDTLVADGIIVRNRTRVPGCRNCLRITIGLPEENKKFEQSLKKYEEGNIRR